MPFTLNDINNKDGGAEFYSVDLQIHSYGGSDDVSDKEMTPEAIIDAAIEHGIGVVCITDHNSAANVERSIEYGTKYVGRLLVLAGMEVTTANGHLLVYFAPEKTANLQNLLGQLNITGEHGSKTSHTTKSMADVIRSAELLGGICIAAHVDRLQTGFEASYDGYPNWKRDIILSSGLYGLEFDEASHLGWYSDHDESSPAGAERKKLIAARAGSAETAARSGLGALQNSDAHQFENLKRHWNGRNLTRLKMNDLNFDGFRTALVDPEARVRAGATVPTSVPRVLGMATVGGFLDGEVYRFSSNLNCFIGGRGTGKSTAVRSLAYGVGLDDAFAQQDNCPDQVVVYCEDVNGIKFRYEREREGAVRVHAKEEKSIQDVPVDAFRIEYYKQGDLSEVAKDPLKNPQLLQDFLDRHTILSDLVAREHELLNELEQNSALLKPLEVSVSQLKQKMEALRGVSKKLKLAETGKVREIAAFRIRLTAEKSLLEALESDVRAFYAKGISVARALLDFDDFAKTAGDRTGDKEVEKQLSKIKHEIEASNKLLQAQRETINTHLAAAAARLGRSLAAIRERHKKLEEGTASAVERLQKKGLSGSIEELNRLLKEHTSLGHEVARINKQSKELEESRRERAELLKELKKVREEMTRRRKAQLKAINTNLGQTIRDYQVVLLYDPAGTIDEFCDLMLEVMQGTYFQADAAARLCSTATPEELVRLVEDQNVKKLGTLAGIGREWAEAILRRFHTIENLHRLETIAKPPRPVIKVVTRTKPAREIPVSQLSDGQKHTILLTIAMLADSNVPLVIDQPEDDLDNAFIFSAVVGTLRRIKERRQVIVVTHNANIAVLGDSELIFPMTRSGENGTVRERGSIDRKETCSVVQDVLEGGELAFKKRQEIYGH